MILKYYELRSMNSSYLKTYHYYHLIKYKLYFFLHKSYFSYILQNSYKLRVLPIIPTKKTPSTNILKYVTFAGF